MPRQNVGAGYHMPQMAYKMASNTDSCKEAVFPHIYYPWYGHEAPAPDLAPPQSDNPPRFADIILNKGMAHYISYRVIDQALISDKCFGSIGSYIHIPFTACCVVYCTAKHTPTYSILLSSTRGAGNSASGMTSCQSFFSYCLSSSSAICRCLSSCSNINCHMPRILVSVSVS